MMRWKKILISAALLLVVLVLAIYVFFSLHDFNKYKTKIAGVLKEATGRELTIAGNIDVRFGLGPTIVVEDISFQNAAWSSEPNLVQVRRLEVQVALLPLVFGKLDFAHLVLVEPNLIVEFDRSGASNFSFDRPTEKDEASDRKTSLPPLIFSDVKIKNGLFTYQDSRSDFRFSVSIDNLEAEIPGLDQSLRVDFKGAFNDMPFTLEGTLGPIWAWVEPGYSLPAEFTIGAAGAKAKIKGELGDPKVFKNMAFDLTAEGPSVMRILDLTGLTDVPELGAFKMTAKISDAQGVPALESLDIQVGSEELVALTITGAVKKLPDLQGITLKFNARGRDAANLTQLGIPPPLNKGPFEVTADISDPEKSVFSTGNLSIILNENEIAGKMTLNLADQVPSLTAALSSQNFVLGPSNLDLHLTGPFEKPAIKKIDLKLGSPALAEIRLTGHVDDLKELQGVDIDFQAEGKDLASLEQVIGQPPPIRGAFSAAGKVLIPVHKNLKIPDLKITVGNSNITGSLNLDLRGDQQQLKANLFSPTLDLSSVLLPKFAGQGWAKGLSQVRPVKLTIKLAGFIQKIAVKEVDLQAGTLDSAEVNLRGSVENLSALRGIELGFAVRGNDLNKLKEITGQPFLFAPVPGQGTYVISGTVNDTTPDDFRINDLKLVLADTELSGWLDINLAAQPPHYEVDLSAPKFNLKPFPFPKEAAYANLNKVDDLGPLQIHSKVVVDEGRLSMTKLDMRAGREQLVTIAVKGSIKNLTKQNGINLDINIRGNEFANLEKITGRSIPLKGAYDLSGKLTDPAPQNYKLNDLTIKLGENNITGSLDLNLSAKKLLLATDLTASRFNLQPLTLPALETLSRIEDFGPLKLALKLAGVGNKLMLENLNINVGREDLIRVLLKGTISDLSAARGMELEFSVKGNDMSNFKKKGGPEIPFEGAFNVSGQIIDPAPKVYRLPAFNAVWGDNNQSGWLELDLSAERPHLKGELSSDKLDLRSLLAPDKEKNIEKAQSGKPASQKEQKSKAQTQASKSGVQNTKVFPAEPLQLEGLKVMDADLKFRGKQVLLPALALDDVILNILLKNGDLEIEPFNFAIGGGKAVVRFAFRSQEKPAALTSALNIDQLEIGPMLEKLGYQRSVEGNMDASFNLDGFGDSVAALMAGLNGNIRIAMQDGRAASEYLDLLEKYLGSGILRMLNPFEEKREFTPINCFVNRIDIKDGLADTKILIDTDRTSIFGAGDVNLKTERLNLGIKPTPKKGAMPANISFSFSELSRPFRLGGTLAQPSLVIDPGRTAFVIGKFAGALALGPVGIAAFFGDVSVGKKDPCAIALEAAMKENQPQDTDKKGKSSKGSAFGDEKKESGGFFRRLFGN